MNDAIHAKGGYVFCQLMHAGRVSHSSLLPDNMLPVAPSALKMEGLVHTANGKVISHMPSHNSFVLGEIPRIPQ